MADPPRFELGIAESKSAELPLLHGPINSRLRLRIVQNSRLCNYAPATTHSSQVSSSGINPFPQNGSLGATYRVRTDDISLEG